MRAYKVSTIVKTEDGNGGQPTEETITQFAGTQALAKKGRRAFMENHGVKMAEVTIEEVEVPTSKGPLIDFINCLLPS